MESEADPKGERETKMEKELNLKGLWRKQRLGKRRIGRGESTKRTKEYLI